MDYERAVVVDAKVKEEQGRPLFGVKGQVRSSALKKDLTGPTLLEMSGLTTNQELTRRLY